nr:PREDICTED: histamine H3 receptor [Lepisosteus oculatus]
MLSIDIKVAITVLQVVVTINLERENGLRFKLRGKGVDEDPKGILGFDETTRSVIVYGSIDYEEHQALNLTIEATIDATNVKYAQLGIEIIILNINDNPPRFQWERYETTIKESMVQGVFCIPLYVPYMLTGRWTFGKTLCKLWLVMDYLMCTSSVFNIVLISYDRFLSVTDAVTYRTQQGKTSQAITKMAMGWLLAFLLYGPAIIAWEHIAGYSLLEKEQCYPEFYFNWYFLITASTVEFFMPFISVTFFNLCIYLNIHRRACSRRKLVKEMNEVRRQPKRASLYQLFQSVMFVGLEGRTELLKPSTMALRGQDTTKNDDGKTSQTAPSNESWIKTVPQMYGQRSRLLKDKKVAKSLAIIVCTFGVCWAPYTLLMIIRAAFNDDCVPRFCYEVTFWLLWVNSAINPFLYPLCHKAFRKAFTKLLCPKEFNV